MMMKINSVMPLKSSLTVRRDDEEDLRSDAKKKKDEEHEEREQEHKDEEMVEEQKEVEEEYEEEARGKEGECGALWGCHLARLESLPPHTPAPQALLPSPSWSSRKQTS